jgi:hypothetical protein
VPNLNDLKNLGQSDGQNAPSLNQGATNYVFLSGADMDPTAIRQAYPGAVFVARGHVDSRQGEVDPHFGHGVIPSGRGQVWGIVIQTPSAQTSDRTRDVTTDDGRALHAMLAGDRFAMGEPSAVLKAAQYWELFPGYVALLAKVVHPLGIERKPSPMPQS